MDHKHPADPKTVPLPGSYSTLPFEQLRLSHVPESSKEPTPVILITLYRPKNNNAFTEKLMRELETVFEMLDLDPRVKCIVMTGHGRMFCAGADLDIGFSRGLERAKDNRDGGGRVSLAVHKCRKPTIAAIQGAAVGVGITMTLPFTIRVAWEKAKIGFVFARRGIIMEACSSFFLPKLVGMGRALHLVTTGSVYEAKNSLFDGLFSELLPTPEAVLPRALEIAQEVAANTSTVSTNLMRELMYRNPGTAEETHLLDSEVISGLFGGPDNTEGVKSFKEKRPAKFTGDMSVDAPQSYPWWHSISTASRSHAEGRGPKPRL